MAEHRINVTANFSQYDAQLKNAIGNMRFYGKIVNTVGHESNAAAIKFVNSLLTINSKADTTKQRLSAMNTVLKEEEMLYNRLGDAAKNGAFGSTLLKAIDNAKAKVRAYAQELKNVDLIQRKAYVSPTVGWDWKTVQKKAYVAPSIKTNGIETNYSQQVAYLNTLVPSVNALSNAAKSVKESSGFLGGVFNNFGSMMKHMAAFTAVFGSFRLFTNSIKEAVKANAEFEYSNATLAAVLGETKNNMSELTDLARELGSTSLYSANEISQMQIVLARLGFSKGEIAASTDAVAKLALATGDELANAATLTGSALRAFAYDATEANRVASVLGVSTTKSALDMQKLRTSMSYIGAVSHQAGFDIEDTVAILGKLTDRGIQATTAGVGLRNILLDLVKSNSKLSLTIKHVTGKENIRSLDDFLDALEGLRDAGMNMEDVANMIQKRVSPSFIEMLVNTKGIRELRDELKGCEDDLDVMAEKMENTLTGATKKLHNAWNGLMISFDEMPGKMMTVVQSITKVVDGLRSLRTSEDARKKFEQMGKTVITLTAVLAAYKVALNAAAIKTAFIAAIEKATAALKTMQTVMMRNPYAAAAAAVAMLTVAYINQKKAVKDLQRARSDERDIDEDARKKYSEETVQINYLNKVIHDNTKSIEERQNAINSLRSIIPDYHAEISKEKGIYNENKAALDEYLKSLKAAIKLEAYKSKITSLESEAINIDTDLMSVNRRGMEMASNKLNDPNNRRVYQNMYGLGVMDMVPTNWKELANYDPELRALARQYDLLANQRDKMQERIDRLYTMMTAEKVNSVSITDSEGLEDGVQGTKMSANKAKTAADKVADALRAYEDAILLAKTEFQMGAKDGKATLSAFLRAEESVYKAYSEAFADTKDPKYKEAMKNWLEKIEETTRNMGNLADAISAIEKEAKERAARQKLNEKIFKGLNKYAKRVGTGWEALGMDKLDLSSNIDWKSIIDKLNQYLASESLYINVDLESGNIEEIKFSLMKAIDQVGDKLSALSTVVNSVDNIKQSFESLGETLTSDADAWDKFFAVINTGFTVLQTFIDVMKAVEVLKKADIILSGAQSAANIQNTATTLAETSATVINTDAKNAETGAVVGNTAAKIFNEHSWMPFVGVALAAGMVAAMIASIASAKNAGNYAEGGIVPGNSMQGDKLIAHVNSGEGILTRKGVDNLGRLYNGQYGSGMAGNVTFEIQGTKLIGTINNTIKSKSGKRSNLIYQH